MFRNNFFIAVVMGVCIFTMTSCFGPKKMTQMIIPQAVNTINSVNLSELNLTHGTDYTIMNTITAEAIVLYSEQRKGQVVTIKEENDEFSIVYTFDSETQTWARTNFNGIARFGYLSNDYGQTFSLSINPEYVVRNIAIYRLINQAKVRGADGVIEPIVSTNVEQRGKDIVFKTTVSAKMIKLKTDAK